jgi:hypothetical protein
MSYLTVGTIISTKALKPHTRHTKYPHATAHWQNRQRLSIIDASKQAHLRIIRITLNSSVLDTSVSGLVDFKRRQLTEAPDINATQT